jgi:hypothetical protein
VNVEEVYAYVEGRLDMGYVRDVARYVAASLRGQGQPIGVAFQPGDGTRYDLLFTPIQALRFAPARVVDGNDWGLEAEFGISREPGTAVVVWGRNGAAGFDFRTGGFEPVYLNEIFETTMGSACTITILFEAIAADFNPTERS